MIVHTITIRSNKHGCLGPSTSREVFGFHLTNASTLVPYFNATDTSRQRKIKKKPRQLYLSDLDTNCASTYNTSKLTTTRHPMDGDDTRYNQSLVFPISITRWGYPYWKHSSYHNNKFGLFDPSYAVSAVDNLLNSTRTNTTKTSSMETSTGAIATQTLTSSTATTANATPTTTPTAVNTAATDTETNTEAATTPTLTYSIATIVEVTSTTSAASAKASAAGADTNADTGAGLKLAGCLEWGDAAQDEGRSQRDVRWCP